MPKFLKDATINLLDGGIEMYLLALYGMAMPSIRTLRKGETKYAPVAGLYGASAELLVKGCLVQAKGISAMYKDEDVSSGVYRFGNDVIEDFRKLVRDESTRISFIWGDAVNRTQQKNEMLHCLGKFKLLQEIRASGLHAGKGCSRDITIATATDIYKFIQLLSQSKKLKPYLKNLPAPEATIRDREAIIEDLTRRFHSTKDANVKTAHLRNMYLVLPYIPEMKPDWVDAFDRIAVAPPTENDLSYLAKTLSDAHSIYLLKNRGGKEGVPVRIEPDNPAALPIAIQNIKRTLNSIPDKFNNDVLNANTRLEENRLDLPIEDALIDLYILGLQESLILTAATKKLTAQQTWPYVAAAYSTNGTPRPCWFIIRHCDELDQLTAYLKRAEKCGNGYLRRRMPQLLSSIEALKSTTAVSFKDSRDPIFKEIATYADKIARLNIEQTNPIDPAFLKKYPPSDILSPIIHDFVTKSKNAGDTLAAILALNTLEENDRKVAITLLPYCFNTEDKNGLISVLRTSHLKGYTPMARKMMFFSDFLENGPQLL